MRANAQRGERACRVFGELAAQTATVEPDDHAASLCILHGFEQGFSEAVRRAQDDGAVHPRLARAEHAAKTGRAELERTREALAQLCFARVALREDLRELVASLRARVIGQETFGACAQVRIAHGTWLTTLVV